MMEAALPVALACTSGAPTGSPSGQITPFVTRKQEKDSKSGT